MPLSRRLPGVIDSLTALVALALLYEWGLAHRLWRDFIIEARPAVDRLLAGDVHGFLAASPPYGGSLVLRAPLMALGGSAGGWAGAYRAGAIACALATGVIGIVLARHSRRLGAGLLASAAVIAVVVVNPATAWAMKDGHPEELLTAVLAVGAVLAALRDRPLLAGLLLGGALASKQWALIAAPIALVACERGRLRLGGAAAATAAAILAPLALAGTGRFVAANASTASAPIGFHPDQIWWALGGSWMRPRGGPHSTIFAPAPTTFVADVSHPLIVALAFVLALAWWRGRHTRQRSDVLLLLALAFLLRCVLDPWNVVYYHVPFLLALAAWEVHARRTLPTLTLAACALVWVGFQSVDVTAAGDASCLFYLGWTVPAAAAMCWRCLAPRAALRRAPRPALPAISRVT